MSGNTGMALLPSPKYVTCCDSTLTDTEASDESEFLLKGLTVPCAFPDEFDVFRTTLFPDSSMFISDEPGFTRIP
jgi:hypothetical protein